MVPRIPAPLVAAAVCAVWAASGIGAPEAFPQGNSSVRASRDVVVSAAVSLTDVLQRLVPIYQTRTGEHVVLNLGASNTLGRQIAFGARVDVFISADEMQMDRVASQLVPGTRVDLLSNQLAIAVPDDRPQPIRSVRDLAAAAIRRIAIGDPAAVPAGVYARQYLEKVDLWSRLQTKLVPAGSVRLALAAVENGAADAAIVYHTDIATASHTREALLIPAAEGPRIVYPAAAVNTGSNPAGARRLLDFLRGAAAASAFSRAGFLTPAHVAK
jgi:molybdate transport system substrate-binding protein